MKDKADSSNALFTSRRMLGNFVLLVLCSQFAFSVLAMKGALLPQMLELWQISKTQFGLLMSIYGIVHNIFYLAFAWVQDRFSARVLIPVNMVMGGITTFFLGTTTDFAVLCFLFVMLSLWCEGAFWPAVLSAVRKTTSDNNQGKIFGLLEGGRGGIELLQNLMTVGLYTALGYSLLGLELAFKVNAIIMIILGGIGSLFGPLYGVLAFLMLEELLSSVPYSIGGLHLGEYWQLIFGPLLILIVLPSLGHVLVQADAHYY